MTTHLVKYSQNEKGIWVASIQGVYRASGRTIDECRRRAIALLEPNGNSAKIVEDVELPERARNALAQFRKAQQRAGAEAIRVNVIAIETAALLKFELGFGMRDVGELMGLSHQRIHQLLQSGRDDQAG